jgi:hypothetical protein
MARLLRNRRSEQWRNAASKPSDGAQRPVGFGFVAFVSCNLIGYTTRGVVDDKRTSVGVAFRVAASVQPAKAIDADDALDASQIGRHGCTRGRTRACSPPASRPSMGMNFMWAHREFGYVRGRGGSGKFWRAGRRPRPTWGGDRHRATCGLGLEK